MNLESEKRLVLLTSILDLNGKGTKKDVLDNIAKKNFYTLMEEDEEKMPSRDEEVWRNNLAFIRLHLVEGGYIDKSKPDNWEITEKGRLHFQSLLDEVLSGGYLRKITNNALRKAKELSQNDYAEEQNMPSIDDLL
ncbi:MAG: winged helix-turn-helix domain-containing protein [Methylobacter sp.]